MLQSGGLFQLDMPPLFLVYNVAFIPYCATLHYSTENMFPVLAIW